jgi:hypothetical protein
VTLIQPKSKTAVCLHANRPTLHVHDVKPIVMRRASRHFLQVPGPSAVLDRILNAIGQQTIDYRGPDFGKVSLRALDGLKSVFKTLENDLICPKSGTGAWKAVLVTTLSPGDRVLMLESEHFSTFWKRSAEKLGLQAEFFEGDWRGGAVPGQIEACPTEDKQHQIKAVKLPEWHSADALRGKHWRIMMYLCGRGCLKWLTRSFRSAILVTLTI